MMATANRWLLLLWCLFPSASVVLSLSSRSSPRTQSHQQLQQQQQQQQIHRRKSPALWRLLYQDDDDNAKMTPSTTSNLNKKPEIMAPAGGWSQLKAAVANGADAIYLGLQAFSARARAQNFDVANDLPAAVQYCHDHDVHVYVALNTLVFDPEMEELSLLVQQCHAAKVDALIVQDLGLCKLIRQLEPAMAIHSSTQQSITSADGVDFCRQQHGATRVVLGRELSVDEISHVTSRTHVEIETFVHGALCVSYSGQCFSSESWGGRSANRGQCAQACRLPYGLIVDGTLTEMADMKYVLSPQDLCGLDQVPALVRAGVSCFKIEGRLKDATYVAATTRAYRNALDQAWENLVGSDKDNNNSSSPTKLLSSHEEVTRTELTQLFSRGQDEVHTGLTPGFLDGTRHQSLVRGRSPRHRGVHMGRIAVGSSPEFGLVVEGPNVRQALQRGHGIVVDRGLAQQEELAGSIFDIESLSTTTKGGGTGDKDRVLVRFSRDVMSQWKRHDDAVGAHGGSTCWAPVGAHVWKTHDAAIEKKFRRLSQGPPPTTKSIAGVHIQVQGSVGDPLRVILKMGEVTAIGETTSVLEVAQRKGLTRDQMERAIGTLGNTDFVLDGPIDFSGFDATTTTTDQLLWCPASQIKQARRQAVEQLLQAMSSTNNNNKERPIEPKKLVHGAAQQYLEQCIRDATATTTTTNHPMEAMERTEEERFQRGQHSVLCRTFEQVDAICSMLEQEDCEELRSLVEIVVDFLEVEGMRDAVQRIRAVKAATGRDIVVVVATPRILKPEEGGIWKSLLALEPDALLVRSTGLLHRMKAMGGEGAKITLKTATTTNDEDTDVPPPRVVRIPKLFGDFSLNAANALTSHELLSNGLDRITASYDLNANAITDMAKLLGPVLAKRLEVVVHCKMPIFHTEHCVFARFLTKGNSYLDCGHACTRHSVHLRDELSGMDNLVLADMGCRNTVFSAQAQSGIHSVGQWKQSGIRNFRIELVDERPYDALSIVRSYLDADASKCKPSIAWAALQDCRDSNGRVTGVTLGSFRNTKERRAGELAA